MTLIIPFDGSATPGTLESNIQDNSQLFNDWTVVQESAEAPTPLTEAQSKAPAPSERSVEGILKLAQKRSEVGVKLYNQGDLKAATPELKKALELYRFAYKESPHPNLARVCNNLGMVYIGQDKPLDALLLLIEAEQIWATVYADNPNHPNLGLVYCNLGIAHAIQEESEAALANFRRSQEILECAHKDDPFHLNLLTIYREYARFLKKIDKPDHAQEYYQKALKVMQGPSASPRPPTFSYAELLKEVGDLYCAQKDYTQAKSFYDQALAIVEPRYEKGVPSFALINLYSALSSLCVEQDKLPEAIVYLEKEIEVRRALSHLGKIKVKFSSLYYELSVMYNKSGQIVKSIDAIYKVIEALGKESGPTDFAALANVNNNLGASLANVITSEDPKMLSALKELRPDIVKQGLKAARKHIDKAVVFIQAGRLEHSKREEEQALVASVYRNIFNIYHKIGFGHLNHSNYGKAESSLKIALSFWKKVGFSLLSEGDRADVQGMLAHAYFEQRQYAKAQRYAQKAYTYFSCVKGESHSLTPLVKNLLKKSAAENYKRIQAL
tara:strand:- start:24735 stop:26399 length:1665 start_codon:yes stop_codon:yes gene_type:complete